MKYFLKYILSISAMVTTMAQDNIVLTELEFNTTSNELAPVIYKNKLIYISDQKEEGFSNIFRTYTTDDGNRLTDYYVVASVGGMKYQNAEKFATELLTPHYEGPLTFDFENDRMYFSQNLYATDLKRNSLKDGNNMMIYTSSYLNDEFRNPTPFKFRGYDARYNYICPSVHPDGTKLFFCSDQPGGMGGYDIYVCEGKNGRFDKPQNLDKNVNTSGDEIYPFAHISGRLYFSSKKQDDNRGRFDVYYTYFYEKEWANPINAGDPFNSKSDDYGVYISDDLKTGYFSSNRKRGSFDIYHFEIKYPVFEECHEIVENTFCYRFYDPSGVDLDTMAFNYEWDLGDGTVVRAPSVDHCFVEPGMYFVQLNLIDKVTGEIALNQSNYTLEIKEVEQVYINSVDTVKVGQEIVFDGLETNISGFEIEEYYWFLGDGSDVKRGLNIGHKYEKEGDYTVKLGITSILDEKTQIKKACGSKRIIVLER